MTVSIAADMIGRLSTMERVSRVEMSVSAGRTSERPGLHQDIVEGERLAAGGDFNDAGHAKLRNGKPTADLDGRARKNRLRIGAGH